MAIIEEKVKPERMKLSGNADADRRRKRWWLWGRYTPALFNGIAQMDRVLVTSAQAYVHLAFAFQPSNRVFAHSLVVIAVDNFAGFAILQSRIHDVWARFFSGTALSLSRYNPSDCFVTFPFPENWQTKSALETAGKAYYEFRAALMVKNNEGMTKTYNRFHDPEDRDQEIFRLRDLHAAIDRAVLDSYGWADLCPRLDFILDYEEDDDDGADGSNRLDHKKPWRYRWADEFRDEVLARLLELNRTRSEEEAQSAAAVPVTKAGRKRGRKSTKAAPAASPSLFDVQEPTE
jgi:hypothetical protein